MIELSDIAADDFREFEIIFAYFALRWECLSAQGKEGFFCFRCEGLGGSRRGGHFFSMVEPFPGEEEGQGHSQGSSSCIEGCIAGDEDRGGGADVLQLGGYMRGRGDDGDGGGWWGEGGHLGGGSDFKLEGGELQGTQLKGGHLDGEGGGAVLGKVLSISCFRKNVEVGIGRGDKELKAEGVGVSKAQGDGEGLAELYCLRGDMELKRVRLQGGVGCFFAVIIQGNGAPLELAWLWVGISVPEDFA